VKLDFRAKKYIVKELRAGVSASKLAAVYHVSRIHVYRLARQPDLHEKPVGRPKTVYQQSVRDLVVQLKRQNGWGVHKLTFMLKRDHQTVLSHNAVHRILTERGEITRQPEKGKRYEYIRFQRAHSNSMWQTDWKWLSEEECWLTAYLDDHSRFIVATTKLTEATTDNTLELFHKAGKQHGYPREVLTDHGSQYWNKYGSRYDEELQKVGVEHILGRVKKPTTTGKMERFWWTYMQEAPSFASLKEYLSHYNNQRQHQSLNYQTPAKIYYQDRL
jgi:putative transposase